MAERLTPFSLTERLRLSVPSKATGSLLAPQHPHAPLHLSPQLPCSPAFCSPIPLPKYWPHNFIPRITINCTFLEDYEEFTLHRHITKQASSHRVGIWHRVDPWIYQLHEPE